jgi:hypothetical protein
MFGKFIIIFASEIPEYIRKLFGRISGELVHGRLENSQDILPMGRRAWKVGVYLYFSGTWTPLNQHAAFFLCQYKSM